MGSMFSRMGQFRRECSSALLHSSHRIRVTIPTDEARASGLGRRLEKFCEQAVGAQHQIGNWAMIRSTLTLTGAMAALAFSAATVHAEPDAPTPIGDGFNYTDCCVIGPWQALEDQYYQDFKRAQ